MITGSRLADDVPGDTGSRGMEIFRRLLFVVGVFYAIWLIAATGDPLWRVKDVRFDEMRKSQAARMSRDLGMMSGESGMDLDPSLNTEAALSLEDYIKDKTQGRLIQVEGPGWRTFFDDVEATLAGKSTALQSGLSTDTGTSYLYFPATTYPLSGLSPQLNPSHCFSYLALPENGGTRYLEVLYQDPMDAMHYAPASLVYPGRHDAVWVFLIAVLAYALLPWPQYGPRTLSYSRNRAVVVPDLLGAAMTAFFLVMPVFVISGNYHGPVMQGLFDVELGWIWLTVVMWLLAAVVFTITITALWYATYGLTLLPEGLRCRTLLGKRECSYAEIERVEPAVLALPGWLKIVMMLAGLLNWRLMGAIWLGSSQETHGIAIHRKDGTRFNVWLDYLDGSGHVFHELRRAQVPMSPELTQYVDEWLAEFPGEEPWPNANKRKGRFGPVLFVLALTLSLGIHFWPVPPPKVYKESRALSPEVMARRARLLEEMNQVRIEMDATMRRYQEGPPGKRMQELDHFTELSNHFDEISKTYDALWSDTP